MLFGCIQGLFPENKIYIWFYKPDKMPMVGEIIDSMWNLLLYQMTTLLNIHLFIYVYTHRCMLLSPSVREASFCSEQWLMCIWTKHQLFTLFPHQQLREHCGRMGRTDVNADRWEREFQKREFWARTPPSRCTHQLTRTISV